MLAASCLRPAGSRHDARASGDIVPTKISKGAIEMARNLVPALFQAFAVLVCTGYAIAEEGIPIDDKSFKCLAQMTKVKHFYVDNLLGDLDGTIAVAKSETGGVYPPGSVLQLFAGEVMVKQKPG